MISLSGLIGGVGGLGLVMITQTDDVRTAIGLPLAGSAAGAESQLLPGALLNRVGGEWSLSTRLLSPIPHPLPGKGGKESLAWRLPLLKIDFR